MTKSPSSRALLNQMRIRRASVIELDDDADEVETTIKRAGTLGSIRVDTSAELIESLQSKIEENSAALMSMKEQLSQVSLQLEEQLSQVSLQLATLLKQQQIGTVQGGMD